MTTDLPGAGDPFDDLITEALQPTVVSHAVVILGPGPVAMAMTADAAEISGKRLMDAAAKARGRG